MKSSRISDKQWIDKDMHVTTQQVKNLDISLENLEDLELERQQC